jgi:hypothetical protein
MIDGGVALYIYHEVVARKAPICNSGHFEIDSAYVTCLGKSFVLFDINSPKCLLSLQ